MTTARVNDRMTVRLTVMTTDGAVSDGYGVDDGVGRSVTVRLRDGDDDGDHDDNDDDV